MDYVIALLLIALIVAAIKYGKNGNTNKVIKDSSTYTNIEHLKQGYLTSKNEQKLFQALRVVLGDRYMIHCQTSLIALTKPTLKEHRSKAYNKPIDFVITDWKTEIKAVIELDDSSHKNQTRYQRDQYVNHALLGIHPFLRVETQNFYSPEKIAEALKEKGFDTGYIEKKTIAVES
mgnify:CR=1 FL=1